MILEGVTSLPRHLRKQCTALIRTPRAKLMPRCIGTLPVPPLIHHMKVHRRTRTSNNNSSSSMVDMLIHNRRRQVVHMGHRQLPAFGNSSTPRAVSLYSSSSIPPTLAYPGLYAHYDVSANTNPNVNHSANPNPKGVADMMTTHHRLHHHILTQTRTMRVGHWVRHKPSLHRLRHLHP